MTCCVFLYSHSLYIIIITHPSDLELHTLQYILLYSFPRNKKEKKVLKNIYIEEIEASKVLGD